MRAQVRGRIAVGGRQLLALLDGRLQRRQQRAAQLHGRVAHASGLSHQLADLVERLQLVIKHTTSPIKPLAAGMAPVAVDGVLAVVLARLRSRAPEPNAQLVDAAFQAALAAFPIRTIELAIWSRSGA